MANWQGSKQQRWNPNEPPITDPPTKPLMTPYESEIPLTQFGVPYEQPQAPIVVQPGGYSMPNINCPPGLEYLMNLDSLMIDRQFTLFEGTRYDVKTPSAQPLYHAIRDITCCDLMHWRVEKLHELPILDEEEREVIRLHYLEECCSFNLPKLEVRSNGVLLGSIGPNWDTFKTSFSIYDASGDVVLSVVRPGCTCDYNFYVFTSYGEQKIGHVGKKNGLTTGIIDVTFPADLDVKLKAVLLGAWFLINVFTPK